MYFISGLITCRWLYLNSAPHKVDMIFFFAYLSQQVADPLNVSQSLPLYKGKQTEGKLWHSQTNNCIYDSRMNWHLRRDETEYKFSEFVRGLYLEGELGRGASPDRFKEKLLDSCCPTCVNASWSYFNCRNCRFKPKSWLDKIENLWLMCVFMWSQNKGPIWCGYKPEETYVSRTAV